MTEERFNEIWNEIGLEDYYRAMKVLGDNGLQFMGNDMVERHSNMLKMIIEQDVRDSRNKVADYPYHELVHIAKFIVEEIGSVYIKRARSKWSIFRTGVIIGTTYSHVKPKWGWKRL